MVACANVQDISFGIDGRRVPYRPAGWTVQLCPDTVFYGRTGCLGNSVGFPDSPSGRRVQCDDASPKRTARISRVADLRFLARGNRHIQAAIVELRRSCDCSMRMFIDSYFPEDLSNFRVNGVNVSGLIAEIRDQFTVGPLLESNRAANARFDF